MNALRHRRLRPVARRRLAVAAVFAALTLLSGTRPSAASDAAPFAPGERLTFQLNWLFIPAGQAVLEILPVETLSREPVFHFLLTARSNAWVDPFYRVRDRIQSWTDPAVSRSLRYEKKQREGGTHRDVAAVFDWDENRVHYTNFGRSGPSVPLLPGTLDPLSALYHVRGADLEPGAIIERPVSDGKKCVVGKAAVIRRETIRVAGRSWAALLIEPELKHVGGVFEKSEDASIQLWVSDDARHLPLRVKSRVAVGSFIGELVHASGVIDGF